MQRLLRDFTCYVNYDFTVNNEGKVSKKNYDPAKIVSKKCTNNVTLVCGERQVILPDSQITVLVSVTK